MPPAQREALERAQAKQLQEMHARGGGRPLGSAAGERSLEERVEELLEARADREESGDGGFYGTEPSFFALAANPGGAPTLVACRNDEFDMRRATVEEKEGLR